MSSYTIKELPLEERPRERLLRHGPENISTAELIAIVLGNGTKGKSVIELGHEIVKTFPNLADATVHELCKIKGVGTAQAIKLKAALSLASRLAISASKTQVINPDQCYLLVKEHLAHQKKEIFGVVLLDVKGMFIQWAQISVGILDQTLVHPREVFQPAIRYGAASMILVHNHPSGDLSPSPQDYKTTEALISASHLMRIPIKDHLIVSAHGYFSMREHKDFLFAY